MDPVSGNGANFIPLSSAKQETLQVEHHQEKRVPLSQYGLPLGGEVVDARRSDLKQTAQTFEALFILQLLNEMEKTLEEGSIFGGGIEGQTHGDLLRWELAKRISSRSPLGIADALIQQLEQSSEQKPEKGEKTP